MDINYPAIRDAEDVLDSAEKELDEVYAELGIPADPEDLPESWGIIRMRQCTDVCEKRRTKGE